MWYLLFVLVSSIFVFMMIYWLKLKLEKCCLFFVVFIRFLICYCNLVILKVCFFILIIFWLSSFWWKLKLVLLIVKKYWNIWSLVILLWYKCLWKYYLIFMVEVLLSVLMNCWNWKYWSYYCCLISLLVSRYLLIFFFSLVFYVNGIFVILWSRIMISFLKLKIMFILWVVVKVFFVEILSSILILFYSIGLKNVDWKRFCILCSSRN